MASVDQFKPGAGGLQVSVAGAPGQPRELGKNFQLGSAPPPPALTQMPVPSQQQAQIGQGSMPKGAQPVSLMGSPAQGMPVLGQQPQAHPMLGQNQPGRLPLSPHNQPAPQQPRALDGQDGEVHTIIVEGLGNDGKTYSAEYDVVFPRGTKVMGVKERFGS